MLDHKLGLDPELRALLDRERLVLESVDCAGGGEIDRDVRAAGNFQRERLDNALPRIFRVGYGCA